VTTPGSVELNKKMVVFHKFFIKVCISENEDTLVDFGGGHASKGESGCESQY